jgi:hypothetical protein
MSRRARAGEVIGIPWQRMASRDWRVLIRWMLMPRRVRAAVAADDRHVNITIEEGAKAPEGCCGVVAE